VIRGLGDASPQDPQIRAKRDVGWPDRAAERSSDRGKVVKVSKTNELSGRPNSSKRGMMLTNLWPLCKFFRVEGNQREWALLPFQRRGLGWAVVKKVSGEFGRPKSKFSCANHVHPLGFTYKFMSMIHPSSN
jgi:hypothetical protein